MAMFSTPPEVRYRRRMRRIERWQKPLGGPWSRFVAWVNMIFVDHGIFRTFYLNKHQVTEDFWRAAQPSPNQIRRMAEQGIRTIINLRGGREFGSFPLEAETCQELGLALEDIVVRSREAPKTEMILAARELFEKVEYPALVHCKSGADRAGFMSALYLLMHEGRPLEEAVQQLHIRYGHFKSSKTGILDLFFLRYGEASADHSIDFIDWVKNEYDPEALKHDFHANALGSFFGDRLLRRE